MSENPSKSAPLPVVLAVLALAALFYFAVRYFYGSADSTYVGDGIHTIAQRKANLAELHAKEKAQSTTYGWANEKDKVVRLPIDRAMELTLQKYAARK